MNLTLEKPQKPNMDYECSEHYEECSAGEYMACALADALAFVIKASGVGLFLLIASKALRPLFGAGS